jgi:ABC-type Mn2+/Zn2+ transport system permease subunit
MLDGWGAPMIAAFLDSWALFHDAYLAGWLIGVLLSLVGVFVVARDQVFIGAAVSQASLLGIAVGIWSSSMLDAASWRTSELFHALMGGLFAVLAAFVTARAVHRGGHETPEAVTGWVFLGSTSASILLMSHNPLGMEEINRLLASTLIGAYRQDVWIFLGLTLLTVVLLSLNYRSVVLVALEPEMARVAGLRVGLWNGLLSAWLGLVLGFAIHVSGVVYAFASLVLPALIAKNLGRTARSLFFLAPCTAFATGVLAFALANHYDFPPGQAAAACLCLLLACAWLLRAARAR